MKAEVENTDLSAADICAAAKVSIGTLYNFWGTKNQVRPKTANRILRAFEQLKKTKAVS